MVWWLLTARKQQHFTEWIGLKKVAINKENKIGIWISGIAAAFVLSGYFVLRLLRSVEMATSEFEGMGMQAFGAIIVYALFNTALPEELLFRGFLLKRLKKVFGFAIANILQAVLFGLLHGILFISLTGILQSVLIIAFTGIVAWFMGYIDEEKACGSIIPSWIIHSAANLFSGISSAFLLI